MNILLDLPADADPISKSVPALRLRQPIGEIYLAAIDHELLQKITYFDVRRVMRVSVMWRHILVSNAP